jgi:hypothetical protein
MVFLRWVPVIKRDPLAKVSRRLGATDSVPPAGIQPVIRRDPLAKVSRRLGATDSNHY